MGGPPSFFHAPESFDVSGILFVSLSIDGDGYRKFDGHLQDSDESVYIPVESFDVAVPFLTEQFVQIGRKMISHREKVDIGVCAHVEGQRVPARLQKDQNRSMALEAAVSDASRVLKEVQAMGDARNLLNVVHPFERDLVYDNQSVFEVAFDDLVGCWEQNRHDWSIPSLHDKNRCRRCGQLESQT